MEPSSRTQGVYPLLRKSPSGRSAHDGPDAPFRWELALKQERTAHVGRCRDFRGTRFEETDKIVLQCANVGLRNGHIRHAAESGIDAVDRLPSARAPADKRGGRLHAPRHGLLIGYRNDAPQRATAARSVIVRPSPLMVTRGRNSGFCQRKICRNRRQGSGGQLSRRIVLDIHSDKSRIR